MWELCCVSVAWETPVRSPEDPAVSSQSSHVPVEVQMLENLPGSVPELKEQRSRLTVRSTQVDQYENSIPGQTDGFILIHLNLNFLPLIPSSSCWGRTVTCVFNSWPSFFAIPHIIYIFLLKGVSGRKVSAWRHAHIPVGGNNEGREGRGL